MFLLMNCQYDENIQENPVFKEIAENHKDLIEKVIDESWIICIPRSGSLETNCISVNDILDHILVSDIDIPSVYTCTLSRKQVHVQDKVITPKNEDLYEGKIQILFEETFYTEHDNKYTVWCIDKPLNSKTKNTSFALHPLDDLYDCVDLLWSESFGDNVLDDIHKLCDEFFLHNINFITQTLQVQKDLIGSLYSQCLQATLKNTFLIQKINTYQTFLDNVKLAVETCMQNYLRSKLFFSVCTCVWKEDAEFNKHVQNLPDLEFEDFNLSEELQNKIVSAKCELSKMNKHSTILGKVNCLKNTFNSLSRVSPQKTYITTDDLLQIFAYLILKLNINNWFANLTFITEFRFSSTNVSDENSFLITSLEAAVYYIKNGPIMDTKSTSFDWDRYENISDMKHLLEINNNKDSKTISSKKLCHPLCTCVNCKKSAEILDENSFVESKRQTVLHLAALHDKRDIVERLIDSDFDVNAVDQNGNTALHLAAQKGHQHVLLYLIHAAAKVNLQNNEGNTCLHLAVNNGHETCVKAILYCAKHIDVNKCNSWGNTALHLASKWGYVNIVNILIESGASINVTNKSKQKPIHLAHNYYVHELLEHGAAIHNVKPSQKTVKFADMEDRICKTCPANLEYGIQAKTAEQNKKIDLLLKAVENNDLPLTCFYLGFPNPTASCFKNFEEGNTCHPLCNCEKCRDFSENEDRETSPTVVEHCNINICNSEGFTALHVSAKYGRVEILRLLLDSGASPNVRTYGTFYTPLHIACMNRQVSVVRELLKCGSCSVDVQDVRGNTPLFYACLKNDVKIFELLLIHGADTNIKNNNSVTVWQEAERKMLSGILKLLGNSKRCIAEDSDTELFE